MSGLQPSLQHVWLTVVSLAQWFGAFSKESDALFLLEINQIYEWCHVENGSVSAIPSLDHHCQRSGNARGVGEAGEVTDAEAMTGDGDAGGPSGPHCCHFCRHWFQLWNLLIGCLSQCCLLLLFVKDCT